MKRDRFSVEGGAPVRRSRDALDSPQGDPLPIPCDLAFVSSLVVAAR
jgi:hypothetical protein